MSKKRHKTETKTKTIVREISFIENEKSQRNESE
jgi:hypothetical protein